MTGCARPGPAGRSLVARCLAVVAGCSLLAGGALLAGCAGPGATEPAAGPAEGAAPAEPPGASGGAGGGGPGAGELAAGPPCTGVSVHCGAAPTLSFDDGGRLWAAFEQEDHVWVSSSADRGKTFSEPKRVNPTPEAIETNGENRPKVVPSAGGTLYVSWTRKLEGRFTGEIRFARSLDRGRSFEAPRTINDDGLAIGHRFESLHVDSRGDVYLAWIDKRDLEAARERGEAFRGASLYYTVSTDRGASFAPNRAVERHACECCRIALTDGPGEGVAAFWRHVFEPNLRDHAFAVLGRTGVVVAARRSTWENWELDGCPHHGPAMVPAGGDRYHLAWFTAAGGVPALYYGRLDGKGGLLGDPFRVAGAGAGHPSLAAAGGSLYLAWKEAGAEGVSVRLSRSTDGGDSWQAGPALARTDGAGDHPFLISDREEVFLSWHTEAEGLRVLPVW